MKYLLILLTSVAVFSAVGVFGAIDTTGATVDGHTVYIVKTKAHPRVDRVVDALNKQLSPFVAVVEYDMQGSYRVGDRVVKEIEAVADRDRSILIGIGAPATELLIEAFPQTPILHTMTDESGLPERVIKLADRPSISEQVQMLSKLVPSLSRVGMIVSRANAADVRRAQRRTSGVEIVVAEVSAPHEVPQALRSLSGDVQAMLFVRDSVVLNKDSIEYIVTQLTSSRRASMVYSEYLVRSGFFASFLIKLESLGLQAERAVASIIANGRYEQPPTAVEDYDLIVNAHAMQLLGLDTPNALNIRQVN
ncbi:MAG: hypothetical protein GKR90_26840 [Pseudomonadales bacterium]|nr:hypothetical protein [Pseudomonadales bacterium]